MSKRRASSAIVIAKLLSTEGFTSHTSECVKSYALRNGTPNQRRRWEKIRRAFSAMVKEKLDDGDKIIMGRFIAVLSHIHFDTGLRIGLTAFALDHAKEADDEIMAAWNDDE
jgi:hypothetical protein